MGKQNYCKPKVVYVCTAPEASRCKFYKEYAAGGCLDQRVEKCVNSEAQKEVTIKHSKVE